MPISFGRRASGGGGDGGDGASVDLSPYNVHVLCFYLYSANVANFDANAMTGHVFRIANLGVLNDHTDYNVRLAYRTGPLATVILSGVDDISHLPSQAVRNFWIGPDTDNLADLNVYTAYEADAANIDIAGEFHVDQDVTDFVWNTLDEYQTNQEAEKLLSTILTFWLDDNADSSLLGIVTGAHAAFRTILENGQIRPDVTSTTIRAGYLNGNVATVIMPVGFVHDGGNFLVNDGGNVDIARLLASQEQTDIADIDGTGDWMIEYNAPVAWENAFSEIDRAREDIAGDIDDLADRAPFVEILSGNFGNTTNANLAQWRGASTDITKPADIGDDEFWAFDFTGGDWQDLGDHLYIVKASVIGDTTAVSGDTADLTATPKAFARIVSHQGGRTLNFTWGTGDILLLNSTHLDFEGGTIKIYRVQ